MKKTIITLVSLLTIAVSANAMSYSKAKRQALFLTDKMAYELRLTGDQYDAAYEINLDYLLSLGSAADITGISWTRRNIDLSYVLTSGQYNDYCTISYFYRPVYWDKGFEYSIYTHYTDRKQFYCDNPTVYDSYRGAHSWSSNNGSSWYRGRNYFSTASQAPAYHGTTPPPARRQFGTSTVTSPSGFKLSTPTVTRRQPSGNGFNRGTGNGFTGTGNHGYQPSGSNTLPARGFDRGGNGSTENKSNITTLPARGFNRGGNSSMENKSNITTLPARGFNRGGNSSMENKSNITTLPARSNKPVNTTVKTTNVNVQKASESGLGTGNGSKVGTVSESKFGGGRR